MQSAPTTGPADLSEPPPTSTIPTESDPNIYRTVLPILFTPGPQPFEFILDNANRTIPANIINELTYANTGGGGGGSCMASGPSPRAESYRPLYQRMERVIFFVCGYSKEEPLEQMAIFPDGRSVPIQSIRIEESYRILNWLIPVDAPSGTYHLVISGSAGVIDLAVQVIAPIGAKMIYLPDESLYVLHNFQAGEKVKLVYYQQSAWQKTGLIDRLAGWQEVQVDSNGQRKLKITYMNQSGRDKLIAVGDQSGEAHASRSFYPILKQPDCTGAPRQSLILGQWGLLRYDVTELPLREEPGVASRVTANLERYTQAGQPDFLVLEGPVCRESRIWWRVMGYRGESGWIAESDGSEAAYPYLVTYFNSGLERTLFEAFDR